MKYTIILLFGIIILFVSGCSREKKQPIHIGVNDWPPCEIWYIAKANGYFGSVPVELIRFSVWSDNMRSLYIGNTDITHSTYFNAMHYSDKGEKAKIILSSDTIEGGDGLAVKSEIARLNDLKNKRIAVEMNTDEHFLLYKVLKQSGISISDVTIINVPAAEGMELFIAGKADALYTYEPFLSEAAAKGNGRIISTTADMPGYMTDTLLASEKLIQNRPEDLKIIISAWYKAQNFIKMNPDEAYKIMAANEGMPTEDFKGFYESFRFHTAEENRKIAYSQQFKRVIAEVSAFLNKKPEEFENIYTTEFLP